MAHHNSTPKSVLNAPSVTRRWIVQYTSDNRAARRHFVLKTGKRIRRPFLSLGAEAPNQPYRKPRRSANV